MSQTGANIHQGKMFNQMEDESFSEMKLFTNTKEWISYCAPHQSLSNESIWSPVLSLEGWMLNVPDKIGVTPGPRQTEMSTEPTPISTA